MIFKTEFFKLIDECKDEDDILKQIEGDKCYDKNFDYTYVFLHDEGTWCEVFKLIKPDKIVNIDVPIVLGILMLYGRSIYETLTNYGAGYFDTLCGLLFLLFRGMLPV